MKKLLFLIATMIMCDAYGEYVVYLSDDTEWETTTCDSGGNITMPTKGEPTKTGFRFIGYREATTDEILQDVNGIDRSYTSTTWTVTFPYGIVSGETVCSTVAGTSTNPPTKRTSKPASGGKECWCKLTDVSNTFLSNVAGSFQWLYFSGGYGMPEYCRESCSSMCAYYMRYNPNNRRLYYLGLK